jgi:hypothetical protein
MDPPAPIAGTCDVCARLLPLTPAGKVYAHDTAGPAVRAITGKRRRRCPGSGKQPRQVER